MLSLKEKDRPIVRKLLDAGCCARCVLRFCCVGKYASYQNSCQVCVGQSHDASGQDQADNPPCKKMKLESVRAGEEASAEPPALEAQPDAQPATCVTCLGVLQDFCHQSFVTQVCEVVKKGGYQFDSLLLAVSLPAQLSVREVRLTSTREQHARFHSPRLQRLVYICIVSLSFFCLFLFSLSAFLLVAHQEGTPSAFEVSIGFTHAETDGDCHFLATACSDCFKPAKNKASVFTRMAVVKALEKISDEEFLRCESAPLTSRLAETTCLHSSVFIAGRYNKFSRELPQTPWVIDGERRMEGSVEELIAAPLLSSFRADAFNFSSSGREDVDVRTLGNGRPFAMELVNPHRVRHTKAEVRQLQETINASSDKIRVRDLQIVTREAMGRMKEGEEEKTKSYSALIWTKKAITKADLDELKIDQKTPLRVLHRRPLAVRQRTIHSMSASYLDTHHFTLLLRTQAGTYIKEFVHGDFGRTKPNLGGLMETEADILELDVESVDVDWPPAVPE
uniref:tRNA pseudouridine(55) synthase n=1 Tax=Electrophorus electricus TaxID=8005 RepID=A0AAY5EYD8_ELEEL